MTYQTTDETNVTIYSGFIRDITSPKVIENIIAQLEPGYVVGEYLNRVVGGVHCERIAETEVENQWETNDPSHTLKAVYTISDLEVRIAKLRKSYTS